MNWTKADLRRVQSSLDLFRVLIRDRGIRPGKEREVDAYVREYAVRFVVDDLRRRSTAEGASPREQRAAARLAARVEIDGLPEGVTLPRFSEPDPEPVTDADVEPDAPTRAPSSDSGPTPMWSHPLSLPVDWRIEAAYYATIQRASFVPLREWLLSDGSEGPTLHWHAWARETAEQLGVGKGWASIEGATVPDDHPHVAHVQRVLVAAAESVELPRGIVALDLRGLGFRCVRALAEALVAAARKRAAEGEAARGAVLVADHYPSVALGRCVDLSVE